MKKDREAIERQLVAANQAKERLHDIAEELEALGANRKAKSCMNLVYAIETWQNRGL